MCNVTFQNEKYFFLTLLGLDVQGSGEMESLLPVVRPDDNVGCSYETSGAAHQAHGTLHFQCQVNTTMLLCILFIVMDLVGDEEF